MLSLAGSVLPGGSPTSAQLSTWAAQGAWGVHQTEGDDRAAGTIGDPVATPEEVIRRVPFIRETIDITMLSTYTADVYLAPAFCAPVYVYVRSVPVPMFSGTLTAGTLEWSNASQQEINAICSALPTSWTASDLLGKPMRITTAGARFGNSTFVAADIASKTALCAGWMAPGYFNSTAVSGDAFEVSDIVRCTGTWHVAGTGPGLVWFEDIEVGGRGQVHDVQLCSRVNATRSRLHGVDVLIGADLYMVGCYAGDGLRYYGNATIELTAMVRSGNSPLNGRPAGSVLLYEQNIIQGSGWLMEEGTTSVVDSGGSVSVCDTTIAYSMLPHSTLDAPGYFWSRNASSRVLSLVGPLASIGYGSGRAPLNVGTGTPTLLVMAGASHASLPQTNANALCNVVVRT